MAMMPDKKVKFTGYAALYGEDLGNGDVITREAIEATAQNLKGKPISWAFNNGVYVGLVHDVELDEKGLVVKGEVDQVLHPHGRVTIGGRILKRDGKTIQKLELTHVAWIPKDADPREKKAMDPRLQKAERVCRAQLNLDRAEASPSEDMAMKHKKLDRLKLERDRAVEDWLKLMEESGS